MKREICPFCGNRWVRSSTESPIQCPECQRKFYLQEDLHDKITSD